MPAPPSNLRALDSFTNEYCKEGETDNEHLCFAKDDGTSANQKHVLK